MVGKQLISNVQEFIMPYVFMSTVSKIFLTRYKNNVKNLAMNHVFI